MIVEGENGAVLFRGKRYFQWSKTDKIFQTVNSQVWNTGSSSLLKDEDPNYWCNGWTEQWKRLLSETGAQKIGYVKQKKAEGPLGILSLVDQKKLRQKIVASGCKGTQIFYPEKVSFFSKSDKTNTKIEIAIASDKTKLGHHFNLGNIKSVLFGRNKDLRITLHGIEDGMGNRINWGEFIPKVELVKAD